MEVRLVKGSDPKFAESITKTNMASYYQVRGITWGHSQFYAAGMSWITMKFMWGIAVLVLFASVTPVVQRFLGTCRY